MSCLTTLEQDILQRHRLLQEKAEQLSTLSASAQCDDGEAFVEENVREVLERAAKDESSAICAAKEDVRDECEVMSHDAATVRLQRVKIQDLENRLLKIQDTLHEKEKEVQESGDQLVMHQTEHVKQKEQNKRQTTEIEKLKMDSTQLREQVDTGKNERRDLHRRIAEYEKERKQIVAMTKTKEVRQKRMTEELERCKTSMESLKINDKDSRDVAKKDLEKVLTENKKLERQKSELVVALRKQMKLIDVLKRQKAHMEAAKMLSFTEEEFDKLISLNH